MKCTNCRYEGRGSRGHYKSGEKGQFWLCPNCNSFSKIIVKKRTDKRLILKLYNELNTLKWIGSDEGWDLAIDAVRSRIVGIIEESENEK
jgi:DNA-directed RNA polymerase subunit RPC12/RpoP